MLPFLKPQRAPSIVLAVTMNKDGQTKSEEASDEESDASLEACGADLLKAIEAKDAAAVGRALKHAYDCCQSAPETEIEPE